MEHENFIYYIIKFQEPLYIIFLIYMFGLIPSILSNIPSRSSSLILKENSRTLEQYIMCLLSRGSIHQGHEGFSGQSRGKQCSFMSLSALLTANYSSYRVELTTILTMS